MGILYIIIFLGVVVAAIANYLRKRELSSKLGREVEDHELVSLTSWIEAERNDDRKKGIENGSASVQEGMQREVVKNEIRDKNTATNIVAEISETHLQTPDNCLKCGAALSKEISRCQFCGSHSSREALEQHTSIFLVNLEKDFQNVIPRLHEYLGFGCFFIPLASLTVTVIVYFLLPSGRASLAFLFGVPLLSLVVAFIWLYVVDSILEKREGAIFDRIIEPKIRQFLGGNRLEPIEFLSIAKRNLKDQNKLLKHIFRRF